MTWKIFILYTVLYNVFFSSLSFGYCSKKCFGEKPSSGSEFDLAGKKYDTMWREHIYDLLPWDASRCFTYSPDKLTPPGKKGLLYAHLGQFSNHERDYKGFEIYFTDATSFWPNPLLGDYGQTEPIFIKRNQQFEGSFTTKIIIKLPEIENCNPSPDYNMEVCLARFVISTVGCNAAWFFPELESPQIRKCSKGQEILRYAEILMEIKRNKSEEIIFETGCQQPCSVKVYILEQQTIQRVTWMRNWSSSFYLMSKKSKYEIHTQHLVYDSSSLISEIGGLLGLTLGWSFYSLSESLWNQIKVWAHDFLRVCRFQVRN